MTDTIPVLLIIAGLAAMAIGLYMVHPGLALVGLGYVLVEIGEFIA